MKQKKFSLKNVDSTTADKISESYPAEWDMDKVFNASYNKFLVSEKNADENVHNPSFTAGDTLEVSDVENVQKKRGLAILRSNGAIAAACTIIALIAFGSLYALPNRIDESPEDIDKIVLATHENNNTLENVTSAAKTEITTQPTPSPTAAKNVSTASVVSETAPTQTEAIVQTEPVDTTETEPVETTAAQTTALPITTEPAVTTDRTNNPWGYFQRYDYYQSKCSDLKYVRNKDEEEEPLEHTIGIEIAGIELISDSEWTTVWYIKRNEDEGYWYTLVQYKYSIFSTQINAESEYSYTEINDRPAVWVNIDLALPALYWDDGCHICCLTGPGGSEAVEFRRSFAENYK